MWLPLRNLILGYSLSSRYKFEIHNEFEIIILFGFHLEFIGSNLNQDGTTIDFEIVYLNF